MTDKLLHLGYFWVNGGVYDVNSSTYSVLWTPPVLAWLNTCVSALGFNMINDDFLQMMRIFLLLLLSHVESHDNFVLGCVVFFNWSTWRSWTLNHTSVKTRQSDDGREKESIRRLCGIQNFPGIKRQWWPPDFTACIRHVFGPGQPARGRSHLA